MSDILDVIKILTGPRFPFKFVYSNEYWMFDTSQHVFPLRKYRLIYENLLIMGARKDHFILPSPAETADLTLVHDAGYVRRADSGILNKSEVQALEMYFTSDVARFMRLGVGGTIQALETALDEGLAVHLGGGFHHAFRDHGEAFCLFNDIAVAAEKVIREGRVKRIMIVDCDLHQGNGTASIFQDRKDVYTFSIHQMDIYPSEKPPGTLDVGLWTGDGDDKYIPELNKYIPRIFDEYKPDAVIYQAGADPFEADMLGGLVMSKKGLKERDRIVLEGARSRGIPVAVLLGGGYCQNIDDTVDIHLNTIRAAQRVQRLHPGPRGTVRPSGARRARKERGTTFSL